MATSFVDTHPLQGAFLANRLDRLADLIVEQGEAMLREAGIDFPSRAVSAVLLIGERGEISAADIAELLDQPHQVTTQRIDLLVAAGIVERRPDPRDGRRKILTLTAKGRAQYRTLAGRLEQSSRAFSALADEIGCDLSGAVLRALDALGRRPLLQRIEALPRD